MNSSVTVSEILQDIKKLFENNRRARVIQIKAEETITNKINQLLETSLVNK